LFTLVLTDVDFGSYEL